MRKSEMFVFVILAIFSIMLISNMSGMFEKSNVRYKNDVFSKVRTMKDIQYGQAYNPFFNRNEKLYMDAYSPKRDEDKKRWVIIFVHGGSYVGGDKAVSFNVDFCKAMAKKGYIVFSINYRKMNVRADSSNYVPGYAMAGADLRAAVRFVRSIAASHRLDPNRITVFGSSAGGGASLGALYDQALDSSNTSNAGWSGEPNLGGESSGPPPPDLSIIDPGEPPVYIQHCIYDQRAPFWIAESLQVALDKNNVGYSTWFPAFTDCNKDKYICHIIFQCRQDETVEKMANWIYSVFSNQ